MPTPTRCTSGSPTSRSASGRRRRPRATCGSTRSSTPRIATGAEAVHPGYGFLAERAAFARAVDGGGPDLRRSVGRGDRGARRQARRPAARPVASASTRCRGRSSRRRSIGPTRWRRSSRRPSAIGFPLLVKAAAGGGGRGMRRVERRRGPAGRARDRRRPRRPAAFGDGAVYLEREVRPARHIEVQLLGDATGRGRGDRRARLLDPAPPPEARRGGAGARADRATSAATCTTGRSGSRRRPGLTNAATAEFLREPDGAFYFLEVNTRLQVEHGVTELVTGLDIVREQFWLAAGRPLSDGRAAPRPTGPPTRRATPSRSA